MHSDGHCAHHDHHDHGDEHSHGHGAHAPSHAHGHGHGHPHGGHAHHHAPASFDRAFAIGISLNLVFLLCEAWFGWRANSLALWADAAHNLSDVAGLVLAWGGALAGRMRPDERHTYGFKRASLWAAFGNAVLLLVAMGSLGWESVERLLAGPAAHLPNSTTVMVVAGLGIVVNGATAWLFMRGRHDDLNIQGAFWHMAGDALVSAGVVLAGALTLWSGWSWLDPVVSLAIVAVIAWSTWQLLRRSLHLLLDGVPEHIPLPAVRDYLGGLPGVSSVPDLHVWAMGTTHTALTAHLLMPGGAPGDAFLREAAQGLKRRFGIDHATLQTITSAELSPCHDGAEPSPHGG